MPSRGSSGKGLPWLYNIIKTEGHGGTRGSLDCHGPEKAAGHLSSGVSQTMCSMVSWPRGSAWEFYDQSTPPILFGIYASLVSRRNFLLMEAKERKEGGDTGVTAYSQSVMLIIDPNTTSGSCFLEREHLDI